MLAQPGVGPRAVRRLEQHFDGAVEFDSRAVEVAQFELALAGQKPLLRAVNQDRNRVGRRWRRCDGTNWSCAAGGGAGTWGFGLLDPQPAVKAATKISPAAATVGSHARLTMRGALRKPYVLLGLEG